MAIAAAVLVLFIGGTNIQIYVIIIAGLLGLVIPLSSKQTIRDERTTFGKGRILPIVSLVVFAVILFIFSNPAITKLVNNEYFSLSENFYRVGSLVFGGGHVVLPLTSAEWNGVLCRFSPVVARIYWASAART